MGDLFAQEGWQTETRFGFYGLTNFHGCFLCLLGLRFAQPPGANFYTTSESFLGVELEPQQITRNFGGEIPPHKFGLL